MGWHDLTDAERDEVEELDEARMGAWFFFAAVALIAVLAVTDGGKGSMPEPISPPCPQVAETPVTSAGGTSGAPEASPSVEPWTSENCEWKP